MLLYGYEHFQFAETCFERARAFDSNDKRWAYYLGRTQAALGKHDQAAISLREALRQNPDYLPAELSPRNLSVLRANWTRAEKPTRRLQRSIPKRPRPTTGCRVLAVQRETARAIEFFRKACDLFPSFGAAHYALALAYRDLGDRAQGSRTPGFLPKG